MIRVYQTGKMGYANFYVKLFLFINITISCFGSAKELEALGIPQSARAISRPGSTDVEWMYRPDQNGERPVPEDQRTQRKFVKLSSQDAVKSDSGDDVETLFVSDEGHDSNVFSCDVEEHRGVVDRLSRTKVFLGSPTAEVEPSYRNVLSGRPEDNSRSSSDQTPEGSRQSSLFMEVIPSACASPNSVSSEVEGRSAARITSEQRKKGCFCGSCWNGCLHSVIHCLQKCRCREDDE